MKKLAIPLILCSTALVSLVLVGGCQMLPGPEPEAPTTPGEETEEATSPATEPESPPTDGAEPEEAAEPTAHSSAYVKFEGADGESKSQGHEGWSEIVSFRQGIYRPDSGATGSVRDRGNVVLEDIVLVKQVDKASPKLAEAICKGVVFAKVEIHLTGPSEGSAYSGTFYAYELKNVMITSYEVSGSNPLAYALVAPAPDVTMPSAGPFIVQAVDAPVEEMSLSFEEIKVTYTEADSSGKAKGNVEYSWKVAEAQS